ncbi:MAG: PAS domain S-box protein [Synechococcaceae cyanobacterium]|nr:PAS domain S-box protein [Synechococcaceae cyanobacterium]
MGMASPGERRNVFPTAPTPLAPPSPSSDPAPTASREQAPSPSPSAPALPACSAPLAARQLEELAWLSSDPLVLLDQHGTIRWANPAWCQATGQSEAQAPGTELGQQLSPSGLACLRDAMALVLAGGRPEPLPLDLLHPAGPPLVCTGHLAPWSPEQGEPLLRLLLRRTDDEELARSRQQLKDAQRLAEMGSWSLDLRRGELNWSDEIYRIFELDPERFQPSYETFLRCVHPDDRRMVDQAYSRSLIDRQPYAVTHRLLMADGRIKFISERCETRFSEAGEPLLSIGTACDVTEATLARERLEASERKLRRLVELAPLGIVLSRLNGQILECNPAFSQISGYSPSELTSRNWQSITPESDRSALREQLRELLRLGSSGPFHRRLDGRDGRGVKVKVTALLVMGSDSEPLVWSILEDISSSLQMQDTLEQAASVFSHCQEGIMITDTAGKILDVNEALCRITGYRREQLIGSNPRRLKSGLHDAGFYGAMWDQLQRTGYWSGEVINRAFDGTLLPVQETISAVQGEDGEVRRYVALLTDIRELKEQQRQLQHLALHDPLTGLPNRVLLQDRIEQAVHRIRREGGQLLVALLDLDGFKAVNDIHGHQAGDHLLKVLAERLRLELREGDTLARLGGDEFVLVLPSPTAGDSTAPLLERLRGRVRQPVAWGEDMLQVGCSLGVVQFPGEAPEAEPEQLLRLADQAMYREKHARAAASALHQQP